MMDESVKNNIYRSIKNKSAEAMMREIEYVIKKYGFDLDSFLYSENKEEESFLISVSRKKKSVYDYIPMF